MGKAYIAFGITVLVGFIGMLIDSLVGLDGNFSVVCAIATAVGILVYYMNKKDNN